MSVSTVCREQNPRYNRLSDNSVCTNQPDTVTDSVLLSFAAVAHYWTSATKQGPNGGFMWGDRKHTPVCKPGSHAKVCHENWGRVGQRRGSTQPDDAEGHENCVAVLNRFYPGDGITWHDTPCHQEKHFVCEPY